MASSLGVICFLASSKEVKDVKVSNESRNVGQFRLLNFIDSF